MAAQSRHDSLRKTVPEKSWKIGFPFMSEDGSKLIMRKTTRIIALQGTDMHKDSIFFFDLKKGGVKETASVRQGGTRIALVDNNSLLLHNNRQAELIDLEKQTHNYYEDVQQARVVGEKKQFVLHYGEGENRRFELRRANGELLNMIENVVRFYFAGNGNIYAITKNKEDSFGISRLEEGRHEKIYTSYREIASLEIDSNETGCMIFEQYPEENLQTAFYLDFKSNVVYPLAEVLPIPFQRGFTEMIGEGSTYFLKLWMEKEKEDTSLVDIWYGNDNRLQEKFSRSMREVYYVWEPKKKSVQQIGTDLLRRNANIGNERYFLSFDPYLLQDYLRWRSLLQMQVYDRILDRYEIMDTIPPVFYLSRNGEYALSPKDHVWHLYHILSGSKTAIHSAKASRESWFKSGEFGSPWFTDDGNAILFEGDGGLWMYDLKTGRLTQTAFFEGYQTTIVNGRKNGRSIPNIGLSKREVDLSAPLVVKLYNPLENITSYILWHNGDIKSIIAPTSRHIESFIYNNTYTHFSYIEEDYNMPPRLIYKETGKAEKIVYESNKEDKAVSSLRQEIISYTNKDGFPLKGVLYYPSEYTPSGKYPMVVHIYEKQRHRANRYPYPSYYDDVGFNIRLLLEKGYFVYLPDIVYGPEGTGLSALDCVNRGLDAIDTIPSIDRNKVGLIGHSHGGYQTNFIATHSNRFAAYVSGAGNSDIIRSYFSFNYNFIIPFYYQFENGQYQMNKSFSEDKHLYFRNNPIHYVDQVDAPILLWTGMKDQNIYWEQTMEFYIGLKRNRKKVISLFYTNEGHSFLNKDAQFDLTSRILDWFDYHLYGQRGIEWIDKGMKKRDTLRRIPLTLINIYRSKQKITTTCTIKLPQIVSNLCVGISPGTYCRPRSNTLHILYFDTLFCRTIEIIHFVRRIRLFCCISRKSRTGSH